MILILQVSKRSYAVMNFPTYKRINSRENSETMDEEDNSGIFDHLMLRILLLCFMFIRLV